MNRPQYSGVACVQIRGSSARSGLILGVQIRGSSLYKASGHNTGAGAWPLINNIIQNQIGGAIPTVHQAEPLMLGAYIAGISASKVVITDNSFIHPKGACGLISGFVQGTILTL